MAFEVGLGEEEARRLNAPYLTLLRHGRPYVHAKWAMTLDGKIATRTGTRSGSATRLRGAGSTSCAAAWTRSIVGIGTVRADDPLLDGTAARAAHPVPAWSSTARLPRADTSQAGEDGEGVAGADRAGGCGPPASARPPFSARLKVIGLATQGGRSAERAGTPR